MVEKINNEEYEEVIKGDYAIIDFSATWCGPCQMLAPVMDELSEEYEGKVKFYNIDVDENMELASELNIQGVPTIIIFKSGKALDTQVGFLPKEALKEWINMNIK